MVPRDLLAEDLCVPFDFLHFFKNLDNRAALVHDLKDRGTESIKELFESLGFLVEHDSAGVMVTRMPAH